MAQKIWHSLSEWLKKTSLLSLGLIIGVVYGSIVATITTFVVLQAQAIAGQ